MTLSEVSALVAPLDESLSTVLGFLRRHGVQGECANINCDFVTATMAVSRAEILLATRYEEYVHSPTGQRRMATEAYSLPSKVTRRAAWLFHLISADLIITI